jgi:hypothetical protein
LRYYKTERCRAPGRYSFHLWGESPVTAAAIDAISQRAVKDLGGPAQVLDDDTNQPEAPVELGHPCPCLLPSALALKLAGSRRLPLTGSEAGRWR